MIEVVALTVMAGIAFAIFTVGMIVLKAILWIVLLPIRLVLGIVLLPLLLLKAVVVGILLVVIGPIVALALIGATIAFAAAVLIPLLPILLVGLLVWLLVRGSQPGVTAA
jgi:hypothetical protein